MTKRPELLDRELFRAARREALAFSFWTDGVVYPLLAGVVGVSWVLVAGADAVSVSMATTWILLGLAIWAWGYLHRRDQRAALIMKERASYLVHKRDQELVRLDAKLQADGMTEASEQIRELRVAFDALRSVLEQKLSSGELGYQRFRVALEELFLSALENLERAVERLDAALAIEIDRVDERMRQIEAMGDDPNSMESIELERARTRYEALTSSATDLFEQNKLVLETLQSSCERITSVQAHRARVRRELEDVLNEMASLSDRVGLAGT
jgi:hypothetical protein